MTEQSIRHRILLIMAMSGGEIKKEICMELCGSKPYYKKMMQQMKEKGEAETIFGCRPRTLHIKKNGVMQIAEDVPGIMARYEARQLAVNEEKSYRRATISQVIYNMYLAGVFYEPKKKETLSNQREQADTAPVYYAPYEIKGKSDENRGSKLCGILIFQQEPILLYNMEDRNIKWMKVVEENTQTTLFKLWGKMGTARQIIFGTDMEQIIMENYVKEQEYRLFHRNQAYNRVTPEAGMYYIPNGKAGTIFLRLFFHPELVDGLKNRLRDRFQIPVISLLPLYLPACVQIMQERQQLGILCLEEQEQFVHWLNDGKNIRVFSVKKQDMEQYLEKLEKE